MLKWIERVPHYIRALKKKRVEGNGGIFIIAIFFMLFLLVVFKLVVSQQSAYITYDNVDDALVSSLVSAANYNIEEYGLGGHAVVYRTYTPTDDEELELFDALDDSEIYSPNGDAYLDACYNKFLTNLKHNLELDDIMVSSSSGIDGTVTIDEFSVFNVYRAYDEDGNPAGYRVVKYTKAGGGWSTHPYNINTPATCYNTFDHTNTVIENTSISAALTFNIRLSTFSGWLMGGSLTEDDMVEQVTYQRIVDIKDN